jgi:RND family efflux transporter MFP subunit
MDSVKKYRDLAQKKIAPLWAVKRNKYIFFGVLAVLVVIFFSLKGKALTPENTVTQKIVKEDVRATVLPTGQVTSVTDLELSFKATDTVRAVNIAVGDKVKKGQVLATLNNGDELGALTQAQGSYRAAQAAYQRTVEGATSEEEALAEVNLKNATRDLDNTTKQQAILVANAKRTLYSGGLVATSGTATSGSYIGSTAPTVSGTYRGEEDVYTVTVYGTGDGLYFTLVTDKGADSGSGTVNTSAPVALGTKGLYIQFPTGFSDTNTRWKIKIPNTESSTYTTNYNAYQSALENERSAIASAQAVVDTRQAELSLKKAAARPADLDARRADILSAQGRLQTAQASYENTILRAPADGTITRVDVKVGEQAQPQQVVMVLQDVSNLYLEANINEANIGSIALGQPVEFTLDAFSKDRIFRGSVVHIDPGATENNGIVNYKIKAALTDTDPGIKPGMNADMTVITYEAKGVIAVPKVAVTTKDAIDTVQVVHGIKKYTTEERKVTLGSMVDGNKVIITSGLQEGDIVLISETKK